MGTYDLKEDRSVTSKKKTDIATKYADQCVSGNVLDYLELREPENFKKAIDWTFQKLYKEEDFDGYDKALHDWMMLLKSYANRLKVEIRQDQIKRIHILKAELKLTDEEYVNLIFMKTRQITSKNMNYCQGEIVIEELKLKIEELKK